MLHNILILLYSDRARCPTHIMIQTSRQLLLILSKLLHHAMVMHPSVQLSSTALFYGSAFILGDISQGEGALIASSIISVHRCCFVVIRPTVYMNYIVICNTGWTINSQSITFKSNTEHASAEAFCCLTYQRYSWFTV